MYINFGVHFPSQELLKKPSEEDCIVGGNVSEIEYPALPSSDDESETGMDEASGRVGPPPGFNREVFGTSGRPLFLRR